MTLTLQYSTLKRLQLLDSQKMSGLSMFIAAIIGFLFLWFTIPALFRTIASQRLGRLCADRRAILLTYDDGPSETLSPRLANLLKRRNVRATFFVLGRNAEQHPELIHRLRRDGHEIASHSHDHLNAWKAWPMEAIADLRTGAETLKRLGVTATAFRPPFGKSTLATLLYGLLRKIRFAYWTHDSRDSWARRPVEELLENLRSAGGGVVLMHDFSAPRRGPDPERHPEYLLHLTEQLIDFAEEGGFNLMRFSDLVDEPASISTTEPA